MKLLALVLIMATIGTPGAAQDFSGGVAADGKAVFARCSGCHAVGAGVTHKVGPHLNDLIGRVAGSLPDYKYSEAMIEAGRNGLAWTGETLWTFLTDPRQTVPGNKMAFPGIRDPAQLADLIAYLAIQAVDR
jgi:cytochrome c2